MLNSMQSINALNATISNLQADITRSQADAAAATPAATNATNVKMDQIMELINSMKGPPAQAAAQDVNMAASQAASQRDSSDAPERDDSRAESKKIRCD